MIEGDSIHVMVFCVSQLHKTSGLFTELLAEYIIPFQGGKVNRGMAYRAKKFRPSNLYAFRRTTAREGCDFSEKHALYAWAPMMFYLRRYVRNAITVRITLHTAEMKSRNSMCNPFWGAALDSITQKNRKINNKEKIQEEKQWTEMLCRRGR